MVDNNFYYVTLKSEAGFLYSALDDVADDYINELIPYDFVEGKNHGKKVNGGSLWDMRRNANGLEAQLEELNARTWKYLNSRSDYLIDQCFNEHAPTVLLRAENEQALLKSFIHKEFDDIMANFDTKIVKLKKKNKVVVCNGVVI